MSPEAMGTAPSDPASTPLSSYDMWDAEHEQSKWPLFARARRECPVAHTDADGGGQYVVTSYAEVRRVLEDPATFSSAKVAPRPSPITLNPLDADPPLQPELRRILNPLFSRTAMLRFEPRMRAIAGELIEKWLDRGRVELIEEFAAPFAGAVLAAIVFDEPDATRMQRGVDIVTRVAVEGSDETYMELAGLAYEYLAERAAHPVDRDDVLNALTTATVLDGRPLSDVERLGVVAVLFLGGLDTTRGAIGCVAHHLARRPELEARLRDPKWIRQDMDEFLRLESPVGCLGREVTRDTELAGVALKKGDQLLIRFDSANRDETKFDDPDELTFGVARPGNAAFGLGIHRCLGAHLGRVQLAIAYDELLSRVTRFRFAEGGPGDVRWSPGIANGPERLDLTFDRR